MNYQIITTLDDDTSKEDADNFAKECAELIEYLLLVGSVQVKQVDLEGECDDA